MRERFAVATVEMDVVPRGVTGVEYDGAADDERNSFGHLESRLLAGHMWAHACTRQPRFNLFQRDSVLGRRFPDLNVEGRAVADLFHPGITAEASDGFDC